MLRRIEVGVHFLMLLLLCGAFIPLWREVSGAGTNLAEGDPLHRIIFFIGYSITLPILLLYPKRTLNVVFSSPFLWLLIGLAFFSSFWSVSIELTLRRSLALLLTTLYAITLTVRFTFPRFLKMIGGVLWTLLFSSILFAIFLPAWGTMFIQNERVWRGVFIHKNPLGNLSALALLIFVYLFSKSHAKLERYFWCLGIFQAGIILWEAKSITAWILTIGVCGGAMLLWLFRAIRRDHLIAHSLLFLSGAGFILLTYQLRNEILSFFGKDPTLTGRVPLWGAVLELGLENKWLGYGFGAFWSGWEGPSRIIWYLFPTWQPDHAHNGYLDVFVNLGVVGLTIALCFLGYILIYSLGKYIYRKEISILGPLFIGLIIILNISESVFLRQNSIWWVLLVAYSLYSRMNLMK